MSLTTHASNNTATGHLQTQLKEQKRKKFQMKTTGFPGKSVYLQILVMFNLLEDTFNDLTVHYDCFLLYHWIYIFRQFWEGPQVEQSSRIPFCCREWGWHQCKKVNKNTCQIWWQQRWYAVHYIQPYEYWALCSPLRSSETEKFRSLSTFKEYIANCTLIMCDLFRWDTTEGTPNQKKASRYHCKFHSTKA